MTHIETLKLALEYLQDNQHLIADNERHAYVMEYGAFIERLCQAIADAEQAQPVIECDCETRTSPDGAKLTQCGSDQMRRACEEGHAFVKAPPPRQPEQEELQATERQVEILSDALAESRKINAELLEALKAYQSAGFGTSTDFAMQREAFFLAAAAIAKHSKENT